MLTLSSTLLAAQKAPTNPLWKIVLTPEVGDPVTYTQTRIASIEFPLDPYKQQLTVRLLNHDKALNDLDFKGYTGVISFGLTTTAGAEYAARPPLRVVAQNFVSTKKTLDCVLTLWGTPDFLARESASTSYEPTSADTKTVKDIITMLFDGSAPFAACKTYTVDFDSEDALLDTLVLKDSYRIYKGESRLTALRRALDKTGSSVKFDNDGHITIIQAVRSNPVTETLWPNGAGDETNIPDEVPDGTAHWQCVDDTSEADYVIENTDVDSWFRDLYALQTIASVGSIASVTVYVRMYTAITSSTRQFKICLKTGGTAYEGDATATPSAYTTFSKTWTTNPGTGEKWTKAEIDALQVGVSIRRAGICYWVKAEVAYDYDYEYALPAGNHPFFAKTYRTRLIIPNRVIVNTPTGDTPAYSGTAVDAASYAALGFYVTDYEDVSVASNAEAEDVAEAILAKHQLFAEGGSGDVPMNVGAEVFDYVKITDSFQGDSVSGTCGHLTLVANVEGRTPAEKWHMRFAFGSFQDAKGLTTELSQNASNVGSRESYFARLMAKDAYIENLQAESIDLTSIELDDLVGSTRSTVLNTHLDAYGLKISSLTTFTAGYDASTKRRVFTAQPTTPYDVGDLWIETGIYKKCTTARASGAYAAGDWTSVTQDEIISGTNFRRAASAALTAEGLVILDSVVEGTYGLLKATQISAGEILLSSTSFQANQDGVISGTVYGSSTRLAADGLVGATLIGAITAFADGGGGTVQVTTATHGLAAGDKVLIVGTTNYDGAYAVTSIVDVNNYKITKAYVAESPGANAKSLKINVLVASGDGSFYIAAGSVLIDDTGVDFIGATSAKFFSGTSYVGTLYANNTTQLLLDTESGVDLAITPARDFFLSTGEGISIYAGANASNPDSGDVLIGAENGLSLHGGSAPANPLAGNALFDADDGVYIGPTSALEVYIGRALGEIGFFGVAPIPKEPHINDPSGGATVDAAARTAIITLLASLEEYGLLATS